MTTCRIGPCGGIRTSQINRSSDADQRSIPLRVRYRNLKSHPLANCTPVTEQFLAFLAEKTAGDGNEVVTLLEDQPAGDETSSPLIILRTTLVAVRGNVFLGNAVNNRANSGPH